MPKIHIKHFSVESMIIAFALSVFFVIVSIYGARNLQIMDSATEEYIACEQAAEQLQKGSDLLTEQVRLYVMTGQTIYLDGYFDEANVTRSRETAVEALRRYQPDSPQLSELEAAMQDSEALMNREYYAMRLTAEAYGAAQDTLPAPVAAVALTAEDRSLSAQEKLRTAQSLVNDTVYQTAKTSISENVSQCTHELVSATRSRLSHTSHAFRILYLGLEVGLSLLIIFLLVNSVVVRKSVVNPLLRYNRCIAQDQPLPLVGSAELQTLAQTYNRVLAENQATQRLIRHEAEYDALTDLLNRGSFDKILALYQRGSTAFALLLADVDYFKTFNDTYGHAAGDQVLRRVAAQCKSLFRSSDYIFRIGGDEFAILMTNVSELVKSVITRKLSLLKERLAVAENGLPAITLSIGVTFASPGVPAETIFQQADQALYYVKEHGKNGSSFFEED